MNNLNNFMATKNQQFHEKEAVKKQNMNDVLSEMEKNYNSTYLNPEKKIAENIHTNTSANFSNTSASSIFPNISNLSQEKISTLSTSGSQLESNNLMNLLSLFSGKKGDLDSLLNGKLGSDNNNLLSSLLGKNGNPMISELLKLLPMLKKNKTSVKKIDSSKEESENIKIADLIKTKDYKISEK